MTGPFWVAGCRVEIRKADSTYQNVTKEWLDLGFSRGLQTPDSEHGRANTENANAIMILQQRRENSLTTRGTLLTTGASKYWWMPLNFYDTREGERRENAVTGTTCSVGGIMTSTEIDVGNLKKWLQGTIGTNGNKVESASQNGYILYYADHRGMLADPDPAATITVKHGDYGYEDFVNPSSSTGASNSTLDAGEDVNGDGKLQTYGAGNLGNAFAISNGDPTLALDCSTVGRMNRVSGARHAIVVENGTLGNLPINFPASTGGFTVASEEPAYILGNYNANDAAVSAIPTHRRRSSRIQLLCFPRTGITSRACSTRAPRQAPQAVRRLRLWPALPAAERAGRLAPLRIEWRSPPERAFLSRILPRPVTILAQMAASITSCATWKSGAVRLQTMKARS